MYIYRRFSKGSQCGLSDPLDRKTEISDSRTRGSPRGRTLFDCAVCCVVAVVARRVLTSCLPGTWFQAFLIFYGVNYKCIGFKKGVSEFMLCARVSKGYG